MLEEIQGLFEFFHRAVEGGGQKEDAQRPSMPGIVHLDADTVFAGLVAIDCAAVVVASGGRAGCHVGITDSWNFGAGGHNCFCPEFWAFAREPKLPQRERLGSNSVSGKTPIG